MESVLIIGAGASGSVATKKCAMDRETFKKIHLASRRLERCQNIQKECQSDITISEVDADDQKQVIKLIEKQKPDIVINLALPYQNLSIMDACLATGVHYLDTAIDEIREKITFGYANQWPYRDRYKEKGIIGILGCGFDPGVVNAFCAYAQEKFFDEISQIDIIDCNDGNHGQPFATNFNSEINIREVIQRGRYWKDGQWIHVPPFDISTIIDFPGIGPRKSYLIDHEEEESLIHNIRGLKLIRFWMTFSDSYIKHLEVLQNVGITRIDPVQYNGVDIVPLQFLVHLLPEPSSLAESYTGKTSIGTIITGIKNGKKQTKVLYNVCNHAACAREVGSQAISYTTGVPAVAGAKMVLNGQWIGKGVFNVEELPSEPFLKEVAKQGLPWNVENYEPVSLQERVAA